MITSITYWKYYSDVLECYRRVGFDVLERCCRVGLGQTGVFIYPLFPTESQCWITLPPITKDIQTKRAVYTCILFLSPPISAYTSAKTHFWISHGFCPAQLDFARLKWISWLFWILNPLSKLMDYKPGLWLLWIISRACGCCGL